MKVYSMKYSELEYWVKNKAKPGDLATYYVNNGEFGEFMYTYYYTKPDNNPRWCTWSDMKKLQQWLDALYDAETTIKNLTSIEVDKYIKEINKLKVEESKMEKRCDNCKYFGKFSYKDTSMASWCDHPDYTQPLVAEFTSCPKHEFKHKIEAPFDNLKFFIKDQKTCELEVKYICEDCGKVMIKPFHWQFRVPLIEKDKPNKRPGYWYWCEDCWEKEKKN